LDVWGLLSLIADSIARLWADAGVLLAPESVRYGIAGACFLAALVLLFLARQAASGGGRHYAGDVAPKPSRRPRKLTADQAFSEHAGMLAYDPAPSYVAFDAPASSGFDAPARAPTTTREILAHIEAKRNSRVIAIIHRENMERGYLDLADLEDALTAIRKTPRDKPLDVIIHSPGGHIRVGQQLARAIKAHPARTTVFVPYFALGSATFMAFAADEIVMSAHAALSPVDPFAGAGPASAVLAAIKGKPIAKVEDETVICADVARKLLDEAKRVTCELMHKDRGHDGTCRLAEELVSGKFSRDRAITAEGAKAIGLNVSVAMPNEIYDLIRSCRRDGEHETSVTFLDHARAEPRDIAFHERLRNAPPVGIYDSGIAQPAQRAKSGSGTASSRLVWLAHSGGHVPEASVDRARGLIRRIEQERGSRVICVIHGPNMEKEAFDFDDLEDVLSAIVASDPTRPLDIVLHTQGGNSFTGRQIARAIKGHRARKTVFVPYYAMSAGTRISLAADQIVMGTHATLGPIDTQLYGWPAPSILHLVQTKPVEAIKDEFLILAEEARKIMIEGRATACELLKGTYSHDGSCAIADEMIGGRWSHGFPITASTAKQLKLNVTTALPDVFYDLVRCFRHADGEDPSVLFISR